MIPLFEPPVPPVTDVIHAFVRNSRFAEIVTDDPVKEVTSAPLDGIIAGKNTYVYDAHTYHTKVPPEGIKALIEHFTRPGDVVLDPFCGSGMTGVAALEAGRKAMLSDLSPAATFITSHLITPINADRYMTAVYDVLAATRDLARDLYTTECRECGSSADSLYTVWSYGLLCSHCNREFVLWDVAQHIGQTVRESKILSTFACPHCKEHIAKRSLKRTRRYPVQIGYRCCRRGLQEKMVTLNQGDLDRLAAIDQRVAASDLWWPTDDFPNGYNTRQPKNHGILRVDQAYTPRALLAMAALWDAAQNYADPELRGKLMFTLTSLYQRVTVFSEFRFWGGSGNTANYNVPQIMNEQNVFKTFERKAKTIALYFASAPRVSRIARVSTQSATDLAQVPTSSVDYIFTDPPFGANINYSEMNLLWESWLRHRTDVSNEAIINQYQEKGVREYEDLLAAAYTEIARVLKPSGWATIVFHNSSADVWEALRNAIARAGLTIEGTQTFDKKHGTFKQFVSDNAVGYDLVLHCRKARGSLSIDANRETVETFIKKRLTRINGRYRVTYLHVDRDQEFDYRKLYAEWLASRIAKRAIDIDFESFRSICDAVRGSRSH